MVISPTPSAMHPLTVIGDEAEVGERYAEVLTTEALDFVRLLHRTFTPRRHELLDLRTRRDLARDGLDFREETRELRADPDWRIAPPAPGLEQRAVEIVGPLDPRHAINALNSGADVWVADFEDATSPTWANVVRGQITLKDAVAGTLTFTSPEGREYAVSPDPATIVVRPRGWHLLERHILVDGCPVPAAFMDFGLFVALNGRALAERGAGPYFYLPKIESHLEARLWNDVFAFTEDRFGMPRGTIRATVIIESISAVFEAEEILFELREHASGLSAGRWDYIFSVVRQLGTDPDFVLPDRADVTMTVPFMRAYTERLVKVCHKRGAHAIGGPAAVVPDEEDTAAGAQALALVTEDKDREATDGFDGTWVAHPALVDTARASFDAVLAGRPHQLDRTRQDVDVTAADLLAVSQTPGEVTIEGVRGNIAVALQYLDTWLDGHGAVVIGRRMEDASTMEIARCQLWQWLHHATPTADGGPVTPVAVRTMLTEELASLRTERELTASRVDALRTLFEFGVLAETLPPFFTEWAYRRYLVTPASEAALAG